MTTYSSITIIYNPNSTGPGKAMAGDLYKNIKKILPKVPLQLVATKRAGHAEELTYELAKKYDLPLIISASGDGGYNEVVNGAAKAYEQGRQPITSLLPAGNANDHHTSLSSNDLLTAIKNQTVSNIDMLHVTAAGKEAKISRRAHSYIGLGLTPHIGKELTKTKLNWFNEKIVVMKGIIKPSHTKLIIQGKKQTLDSLTFSNIDRMAKVLTLGKNSSVSDGLFEVSAVKHTHAFSLFGFIAKATTTGIADASQTDSYEFKTIKTTLVQADGEVFRLPAKANVRITINKHPLRCIM